LIWLASPISQAVPGISDWGTLFGGIGIGALITGVLAYFRDKQQRRHDREMRELDHQHDTEARAADHRQELAVKLLEDKQRLRDRRLVELKAGLVEMVEAFLGLTEKMQSVRLGDQRQQDADQAYKEAVKHFQLARTLLVLDPVGRELMQKFREINTEIDLFRMAVEGQARLVEARQASAVEHGEELGREEKKIFTLLSGAVDRAQQIMEQAAQPVTP
jgi:hypothetical protein